MSKVIALLLMLHCKAMTLLFAHDIWDDEIVCLDTDEECPDDGYDFKDDSIPEVPYPPYLDNELIEYFYGEV